VGRRKGRRSREPREGKQTIFDSRGGGYETHGLFCLFFSVFGTRRKTEQAFLIRNSIGDFVEKRSGAHNMRMLIAMFDKWKGCVEMKKKKEVGE
jgi:hypothetical protein